MPGIDWEKELWVAEKGSKDRIASKSPRGYRVWRPGFPSTELYSPYTHVTHKWKPGENTSTMEGDMPCKDRSGFYSLKSPEILREEGYFPSKDIYRSAPSSSSVMSGEIVPYGKVVEAPKGYRSEKAEISAIFGGDQECEICGWEEARYIASLDRRGAKGGRPSSIILCPTCYKRIKSVSKLEATELMDYLGAVSKHYDVDIIPLPPVLKKVRR